jgi:LCP family protein required for cell wall assembly
LLVTSAYPPRGAMSRHRDLTPDRARFPESRPAGRGRATLEASRPPMPYSRGAGKPPRSGKPPKPGKAARPVKASRGLRLAGWLSVAVVSILVISTLGAYFKLRAEWDSIGHVTVNSHDLGKRPPKYNDAQNILMIGSDTRTGGNAQIGGEAEGQRSDTVMVVHIAPGRHGIVVMSIPRDTVVPVLACPATDGTPGQAEAVGSVERINATFAMGGPTCLWKTVEQETGIHIDHFAELDFVGFKKVVNSLGGVEVCLPYAVNVPQSGLHLSAGRHKIMGGQAIAFWRSREGLGQADDQQRIQRDQFLMASLVQGIEHSDFLASPSRVLSVISDIASSLTIDMDQKTLLSLAVSLRGVTPKSVQFVTAPFAAYPGDINAELEFAQPQAGQLFAAIAHDRTLPKTGKAKQKTAPAPGVAATASTTVLNGTQISQLAANTAAKLSTRGFAIAGSGTATTPAATSEVEYASATDLPAARKLKAQLKSGAKLVLDPSVTPGTLTLILGSNYTSLLPAKNTGTKKLTKTYGGITGNTNPCSDASAFQG